MPTARERTLKAQGKTDDRRPVLRFTLNDVPHEIDMRSITIRENNDAKLAFIAAGFAAGDPQMLSARAAYVAARRIAPDVTVDDIVDSLTIGDLMDYQAATEDGSPEA